MDNDADAKLILTAPPPENWKITPGRPRITLLNTVQRDLRAYNLTLNEAVRTVLRGGWCLHIALCSPSSTCQKRRRI